MIKPYHEVRLHVAYTGTLPIKDRDTGRVVGRREVDEPLGCPRPRAQVRWTGKPFARGSKPVAHIYDPDDAEPWMDGVRRAVASRLPVVPYDYPARVDIDYFFRPPESLAKVCALGMVPCCTRPDLDNLDKGTLDALVQGRLLYDDSPRFIGTIAKWYTCGSRDVAINPVWLPLPMATHSGEGPIDYRTEPGAIIRLTLWRWEDFGLKKPTRTGKPEGLR